MTKFYKHASKLNEKQKYLNQVKLFFNKKSINKDK